MSRPSGRPFVRAVKRVGWTSGAAALVLGVAFFVFQTAQAWIDTDPSRDQLRWAVPTIASILVLALGITPILWRLVAKEHQNPDPVATFGRAVFAYGQYLQKTGRDKALVNLRNNMSPTLHVVGLHGIRASLGEIAEGSLKDATGDARLRLALCQAKGLRHLASLTRANDHERAQSYLDNALRILAAMTLATPLVERDIAQIHYSRAKLRAEQCGVRSVGRLRAGDGEGVNFLNAALKDVATASSTFERLGDLERYTKALFLHVRLLEALGKDVEAREVAAVRDLTLAASEWVESEGARTLRSA